MTGAGDGNVTKAGTEQIGMDRGVGVNQDVLKGGPLGAVASDCATVVEMARSWAALNSTSRL